MVTAASRMEEDALSRCAAVTVRVQQFMMKHDMMGCRISALRYTTLHYTSDNSC
jgi:hypothetical protein